MANKRTAKKSSLKEQQKNEKKIVEGISTEEVEKTEKVEEPEKTKKMPGVPVGYVPKPQEKLSYYTVASMLAVLSTAATAIISFIMYAKPIQNFINSHLDYYDDEEMYELYRNYLFVIDPDGPKFNDLIISMTLITGIVAAVATLFTIVSVVIAVDKYKKPVIAVDVIAAVLSVAALIIYVYMFISVEDWYGNTDFIETAGEVVGNSTYFTVYHGVLIAVALNAVISIANAVGGFIGIKKWNKDGQTY